MSHPELSFSFSVSQLLGLKVCLDFTNTTQPPNMSFDTSENTYHPSCGGAPGTMIKLETLLVDGRRILRLYAIDSHYSTGQASTSAMLSLPSPASSATVSPLSLSSSLPRSNTNSPALYDSRFFAIDSDMQCKDSSSSQASFATTSQSLSDDFTAAISASLGDLDGVSASLAGLGRHSEAMEPAIGTSNANQTHEFDLSGVGFEPAVFDGRFFAMESDMQCNSHDASQGYSVNFSTMPEMGTANFFSPSLHGLDGMSEIDLSRVGFEPGMPSQYQYPLAEHTLPDVGDVESICMESLSRLPTPAISSTSDRSTPESDTRTYEVMTPSGSASCSSSSSSSDPARKPRKRSRKTPSQFIYHCPHPSCTRVFRSEYTCRVHSGVHNPKPRKVVHCTEVGCEETFTRQHDRLRHEVSQHGKICEWSCTTCHRFFSSQVMLEKHKCTSFKK